MTLDDTAWARRASGCGSMTLASLVAVLATHPAMRLYAAIAVAAFGVAATMDDAFGNFAKALAITAFSYPFVEYALHRWVLHSKIWWRTETTSRLWRRVHYDHHRNPADLSVMLAHPSMSVPFLLLLSILAGAVDASILPAMIGCSFCAFIVYEFVHCAAHMRVRVANRWLRKRRRAHLVHHHTDDTTCFGIATGLADHLLGGGRGIARGGPRSPSARTLGYDDALAVRYPWVAEGYARKEKVIAGSDD